MTATYLIVTIMIIAVIYVSYLYFYTDISSPGYANFMLTLTFLATFFPLIILVYQYQENNAELEKQKNQDIIRNLESDTVSFETLFITHYPYLARLYQQIYSSNQLISNLKLPQLNENDAIRRDFYEVHMCSIMFQYIENTLLTFNAYKISFDDPQFREWIFNWQNWFKSPIVYSQWQNMRNLYGTNTANFVEKYII